MVKLAGFVFCGGLCAVSEYRAGHMATVAAAILGIRAPVCLSFSGIELFIAGKGQRICAAVFTAIVGKPSGRRLLSGVCGIGAGDGLGLPEKDGLSDPVLGCCRKLLTVPADSNRIAHLPCQGQCIKHLLPRSRMSLRAVLMLILLLVTFRVY